MQKFLFLFYILSVSATGFAQIQIDKRVEMTGGGANTRITGIDSVAISTDAVNVTTLQNGRLIYAAATGPNGNYEINLNPPVTSYVSGMVVTFMANLPNTGTATLNVDGLGATEIKKQGGGSGLIGGDIIADQMVTVVYDGEYFQVTGQLGNASAAVPHGRQKFTSNGTINVPSGVTTVWLSMSGGGGGGYDRNGGGGGASAIAVPFSVTPLETISVTIGAGGAAYGGNGGTTSFGSYSCGGGFGAGSLGGDGGTGSAGSVPGTAGGSAGSYDYGAGGSTLFGQGANGQGNSGSSISRATGGLYGGGGAGGYYPANGGPGAAGFVLVEW